MFGIYLTYSLYFVQSDKYLAQILITPDQVNDLQEFLQDRLIPERHIDAFTALYKLISGGAFRICAFENEVRILQPFSS